MSIFISSFGALPNFVGRCIILSSSDILSHWWGLYTIMSSLEVFVPTSVGFYILFCPLRRCLSHFVGFICYYVLFGGFLSQPVLGLYIILSSSEVYVPLCWVNILLCPLRRFMSHFVGLIYYSVLFGGFYFPLWGLYIIMPSSEGFVPTSVGL